MANTQELAAMRRAIVISAQGLGSTSPNPPVGCVILDERGNAIGEGYHLRKGQAHAEVNALAAAGPRAVGGTAVVTLEPCNHYGRTPPCRQALIDARVAKVLIAVMDPTSRGEGGAAVLRQAGIHVEQGVLAQEALLVLGPWLASTHTGRPFTTWVYGAASDGSPDVAVIGPVAEETLALRSSHDLVLTRQGMLEEGHPGNHNPDVFTVPAGPISDDPSKALEGCQQAGARSLLIEGASPQALTLMDAYPADRVIAYLPATRASWAPPPWQFVDLFDGYRLTDVRRLQGFTRLVADRAWSGNRSTDKEMT
ncbi:bifunctional diaminohydroxyphosphoribosylaminopyrimidine deaminase/5-amino-6-(5-phosphoribosylamino)uracil reductase RibD [Streptomyces specialis]|uniref:bifunctional diaminohydroxyphosphoribosylaminopyrimidine deaminase/5-amino-6-(5-phosphoribosylamino)uracil reductase RibD n=1 Tax=Streptomyces specialis TaxID=498367 RepID=UPI00099ED8D2|nr:bifunctional diaminohydroxyphosphoribosylaminopyrimidine deaminase/5-amino-6-(5-phosphoribosylamino)uracil reductase RibD [Streptomyces specialis]